MTLEELLEKLEQMNLIAVLSQPDVEHVCSELLNATPEELEVVPSARIGFLEFQWGEKQFEESHSSGQVE